MTGDEIHLFVDVGYEPAGLFQQSREILQDVQRCNTISPWCCACIVDLLTRELPSRRYATRWNPIPQGHDTSTRSRALSTLKDVYVVSRQSEAYVAVADPSYRATMISSHPRVKATSQGQIPPQAIYTPRYLYTHVLYTHVTHPRVLLSPSQFLVVKKLSSILSPNKNASINNTSTNNTLTKTRQNITPTH